MKSFLLYVSFIILLAGCQTAQVYNPIASATGQTFLLNESSLAKVAAGMSQTQVHQMMGDAIVVGYAYEAANYKPLTIANPYKTEEIKSKEGLYTVEYYVNAVKESDGVIKDNELVPLVFRENILVAKGWDYLKALRLKNPS